MNVFVQDRVSYKITKREITDEGFIRVPGRVARTGIQQYLARELGLADRNPMDIINVYRPAESVFAGDSLQSYIGVDVTIEHPNELVNTDNFTSVTAGVVVSAGVKDGNFVTADILIKSKDAIAAVNSGKVQLSAGYTAVYEQVTGTTDAGEPYEFIQRDIKINHVALVDAARAGFQARLFDNKGKTTMAQVTLSQGVTVEVADEATATLVKQTIDGLNRKVNDETAKREESEDEREKMEAERDEAKDALGKAKELTSDEAINERVKQIADTKTACIAVGGATFNCDSLDGLELKRQALTAGKFRDGVKWSEKSDAYVDASFEMAVEAAAAGTVAPTTDATTVANQYKQVANDGGEQQKVTVSARQASRDSKVGAWKKTIDSGDK